MLVYDTTKKQPREIADFNVDLDGLLANRRRPAAYADQLLDAEQMDEWGLVPEWYLFTLSTMEIIWWQVVAFLCRPFV